MKKFIYSLVLCAIAAIPAFAQETTTVYDGAATNEYVPVYGFYADAYNKVEMIMPGEDLAELTGGTITKMTWYLGTPAEVAWNGNFRIYLMEVEAAAPTAYADMTGATLVYEGPLDGTGATLDIEFANDFAYEGGNLLIAVHQVETGTYKRAYFTGEEVAGAAIQGYSYTSLEAVNTATVNTRAFLPKTTFEFTPASGVVYYKPKNLQVTAGVNDAVLTWDAGADETSWAVECKKAADEEWTSAGTVTEKTITLDALEAGVKYDVRVKSIYADGESGWTQTSFATLACEPTDMGEIEYVLTDTYGDGWNGNKLQIYLSGTDVLVAELTIPHVSGNPNEDNLLEGVLSLCYGVDYDLVWVAGSYAYETGFTLTAPDGDVIYEYQGTGSTGATPTPGVLTTFHINQVTCPRPTEVTVENVTYNSAEVAWIPADPEQDLFEVIYAKGDFAANEINMAPIQVNDPFCTLTGLEENAHYTVYVRSNCSGDVSNWTRPVTFDTPLRFPLPENLVITDITARSAKGSWTGNAPAYNFRYREVKGLDEGFEAETAPAGWNVGQWVVMPIAEYTMGGTPLYAAEGNSCMASISVNESTGEAIGVDNWLISPNVDLAGTLEFYVADLGANYVENFSVYVSTTGTATADFAPLATNIATQGVMPSAVENWQKKEFDLSAFEGQKGYIAIRHHDAAGYYLFVDAVKIAGEDVGDDWIVVENAESPVAMENLTPNTKYEAQVQGVFEDGNSLWCDAVNFFTLPGDAVPTAVYAENVTATTADIVVEGSQDLYNLRYRTAAVLNGLVEDFTSYPNNSVPTGWTAIDADGDGNNWYVWVLTLEDGSTQITLSSNSYINNYGALTPDNWIITPQTTLGAEVNFDAWGQDPSYAAEHFQVYVSTTGTAVADFVPVSEEIVATGVQTNYSFDLGPYAGEQGYIAIRHFNCSDEYILNVTNFYMAGEEPDVPAGEWIVVENVETPYTLEGLTPNTKYEVQAQGIVEDKATTEWSESAFFTTLDGVVEAPYYLVGTFNDWSQVDGMIEFVDNKAEGVVLEADAEFKVITPAVDGGWIWYGGVDDNQVGFFLINADLLGVNITLVDGANFRIADAGTYDFELVYDRADVPMLKVTQNVTGIDNITVDSQSNEWYNLNGQKLNGKPVVPGIYINGGKKVIVK